MIESFQTIEHLLKGSLTSESDIQAVLNVLDSYIKELQDNNDYSDTTEQHKSHTTSKYLHVIDVILKNHHVWMHTLPIASTTWYFLHELLKSQSKHEFLKYIRNYNGIHFCLSSIKIHISSLDVIRAAFICLSMIIDSFQNLKPSEQLNNLTKSPDKISHENVSHLILQANIEDSEIFRLSPFNHLVLQLLNAGIGYCLPRSLEYATVEEDIITINLCLKSFDLLIECTKPEYVTITTSYNKWTMLTSLRQILIFSPVSTKKQALIVILKLIALDRCIMKYYLDNNLWDLILQNVRLYGHVITVDLLWLIKSLEKIKSFKNDDLLPIISALLGIIQDRLRDADDNPTTTTLMKYFRQVMGKKHDDIVTRIEPHHVELWPTLNSYNSYGYCIKPIPPLRERIKKAEEKQKARENASRFLRPTKSYKDRQSGMKSSSLLSTPTTTNASKTKVNPILGKGNVPNIGDACMDSISVDDTFDCDDNDFMTSFSCLVLPSMSLSTASSTMLNTISKLSYYDGNQNESFYDKISTTFPHIISHVSPRRASQATSPKFQQHKN